MVNMQCHNHKDNKIDYGLEIFTLDKHFELVDLSSS